MKKTKRILSFLLALTMLFALAVPAMAEPAKPYKYYVSLGDSIPTGCSLPGYVNVNDSVWVPGCYTTLVKEALAEDGFQGARSGLRSNEIRYLLDESYNGDDFTMWYLPWYGFWEGIYGLDRNREVYREAVSKADLITLEFGSNDLMGNLYYAMFMSMFAQPEHSEFRQRLDELLANSRAVLEEKGDYGAALISVIDEIKTIEGYADLIEMALETVKQGIGDFKENWDCIIKTIDELNPDATIVAVSLYNPTSGMESLSKYADVVGILFDIMNNYIKSGSEYCWRTIYADVSDITITNTPEDDTDGGDGMHPDLIGHQQMAQIVIDTIEAGVKLPFIDVADDAWYVDGVKYCYSRGIMKGATNMLFAPAAGVTRAQLAAILYRMAGSPSVEGMTEPFADVSDYYWAHDAIVWACNEGIAFGLTKDRFAPTALISRGQFAAMLYRFAGSPEVTGKLSFKDTILIPAAFRDAVLWASNNGIICGYCNGFFNSSFALSRAQMAVIIARYCSMA